MNKKDFAELKDGLHEVKDIIDLKEENERLRKLLSGLVAQWDEWGDLERCHIESVRKALKESR